MNTEPKPATGAEADDNPTPFVDTPILAAKRKAFDNPTQENLDALIAAAQPATGEWTVATQRELPAYFRNGEFVCYAHSDPKILIAAINAALAAEKLRANEAESHQFTANMVGMHYVNGQIQTRQLVDEINAALAAERETSLQLRELLDSEMKRMEKALAAERENRKAIVGKLSAEYVDVFNKQRDEIQQLREQLAAEKKSANKWFDEAEGNNNCYEREVAANHRLEEQLAAARIELSKVLTGDQLDAALAKAGK